MFCVYIWEEYNYFYTCHLPQQCSAQHHHISFPCDSSVPHDERSLLDGTYSPRNDCSTSSGCGNYYTFFIWPKFNCWMRRIPYWRHVYIKFTWAWIKSWAWWNGHMFYVIVLGEGWLHCDAWNRNHMSIINMIRDEIYMFLLPCREQH